MDNDKRIIKDSSISKKALKAVKDNLNNMSIANSGVESFLNEKLLEVNKKVDSICASIDSIKESQITKRDVVETLKEYQTEVNNTLNRENALTRRKLDELSEQVRRLEKMIDDEYITPTRFDQQINALENKIDSINVERNTSQNSICDYTEKTATYVAVFIQANKTIYNQLGDSTKRLFKSIISTAEQVKKSSADINTEVKSIIAKALPEKRSIPHRTINHIEAYDNEREETIQPIRVTRVWKIMDRFRLGRSNPYQRMLIAIVLTLIVFWGLLSYIMINERYLEMNLGTVKIMGVAWKTCTFLISLESYLLSIMLVVRVVSTITLVAAQKMKYTFLWKKSVIGSVVVLLFTVVVCRYIKDNFFIPGREIIRMKDIILTKDLELIGRGISGVFEYWRRR